MPDDIDTLLRRLIGGDDLAAAEILDRAATVDTPRLLVAASMINTAMLNTAMLNTAMLNTAMLNTPTSDPVLAADPPGLLARAAQSAVTTRDRQLVAVAAAHLAGADELLDVLVREHLADFPDNILAAWIATMHLPVSPSTPVNPRSSHV